VSTTPELLDEIANRGGLVQLDGDRIVYNLDGEAAPLLPELVRRREDIRRLLRERAAPPSIPDGFRLVSWELKPAPVIIQTASVVSDPAGFAQATILQLAAARSDPAWHWAVPLLLDRLRNVGVVMHY